MWLQVACGPGLAREGMAKDEEGRPRGRGAVGATQPGCAPGALLAAWSVQRKGLGASIPTPTLTHSLLHTFALEGTPESWKERTRQPRLVGEFGEKGLSR